MPQGPTITIRCPKCRHPYPMTPTQLSVYVGRTMGCMACGRPFEVREPPPEPEPDPVLVAPAAAGPAESGAPPGWARDARPATTYSPAGSGAGGGVSPGVGAATVGSPAFGSPARLARSAPAGPGPTWLDRVGVAAALAALVLAAAAGAAGYAGSTADGRPTAQAVAVPLLLLRVAVGCAAAAVLVGVSCLWWAWPAAGAGGADGRRPARGTGHATAAVSLGAAELVVAALLAFVAWPPMARALADSHRATCQENLRTLGAVLLSEATARADGRFPDSLADLVRAGKLSPADVGCPADPAAGDAMPAAAATGTAAGPAASPAAARVAAGRGVSYVYLGWGLATRPGGGTRVSTHTVLAYEPLGHHRGPGGDAGGLHVLFADGSVVYVDREPAVALLAELAAGKNPPPAAGLVRK